MGPSDRSIRMAVTGWIVAVGWRYRAIAMTVFGLILVVNTAVQNLDFGEPVSITLVEEPDPVALGRTGEGTLIVLNPTGFNSIGRPDDQARTQEIVDRPESLGIRRASALPGARGIFGQVNFVLHTSVPPARDLERLGRMRWR